MSVFDITPLNSYEGIWRHPHPAENFPAGQSTALKLYIILPLFSHLKLKCVLWRVITNVYMIAFRTESSTLYIFTFSSHGQVSPEL